VSWTVSAWFQPFSAVSPVSPRLKLEQSWWLNNLTVWPVMLLDQAKITLVLLLYQLAPLLPRSTRNGRTNRSFPAVAVQYDSRWARFPKEFGPPRSMWITAHETFKRGYDIILTHLQEPPNDDLKNFLGYCEAWAVSIEGHHDSEVSLVINLSSSILTRYPHARKTSYFLSLMQRWTFQENQSSTKSYTLGSAKSLQRSVRPRQTLRSSTQQNWTRQW